MKTAFGYFFLCLAASMIGVVLVVLYFAFTGSTLDVMWGYKLHRIGVVVYGIFHVLLLFPLTYFGFKWIRKEADYPSPPTGKSV